MWSRGARWRHATAVLLALGLLATSCSGDDDAGPDVDPSPTTQSDPASSDDESAGDDSVAILADQGSDAATAALLDLLPSEVDGVVAADLAAVRSGVAADDFDELLAGRGTAPIVAEMIGAIGAAAEEVDLSTATATVLAYETDGERLLLAALTTSSTDEVMLGVSAGSSADGRSLYDAGAGRVGTLLADGTLIVGSPASVEQVLAAIVDGPGPSGPLGTYVDSVVDGGSLEFVLGLPGLVDAALPSDTVRGSAALSGAFDIVDGEISGRLALHSTGAEAYAARYNALNRHAAQAEGATEAPAELVGADQVVLPLPTFAVAATADDLIEVRNLAKKFFIGMEASDYAEQVPAGGAPWFDLVGTSEADGTEPPAPASVFFRWRFKDEAALAAFEENELPDGYRIAPTRFFETDAPEGEYFFLLNLYNAGGGSIVGGARAEWDVYVYSPDGGPDPNPSERPRFFVVDALAEQVSFDPVNLVTPAEPLSHAIVDGVVTSSVAKFDGEAAQPV